jgi:hypothetical protein
LAGDGNLSDKNLKSKMLGIARGTYMPDISSSLSSISFPGYDIAKFARVCEIYPPYLLLIGETETVYGFLKIENERRNE